VVLAVAGPLSLLIGYLLGSVDFALVVAAMRGVDIRQEGSGNPGASNVLRTIGTVPAVLVFIGDAVKGVIAVAAASFLTGQVPPASVWVMATGLAAVLGHCFPIYTKFKGGKGMATTMGVLTYVVPLAAIVTAVIWALVTRLSRTPSLATLVALAASIPLSFWQGVRGWALVLWSLIVVLVVWRHRANIERLAKRTEAKVAS
jgi:glycerol-3-phosphate acyltransferase PlsY